MKISYALAELRKNGTDHYKPLPIPETQVITGWTEPLLAYHNMLAAFQWHVCHQIGVIFRWEYETGMFAYSTGRKGVGVFRSMTPGKLMRRFWWMFVSPSTVEAATNSWGLTGGVTPSEAKRRLITLLGDDAKVIERAIKARIDIISGHLGPFLASYGKYTAEMIKGEEIIKFMTSGKGPHTCMTKFDHEDASAVLGVYRDNPDRVRLVVLRNKDTGVPEGRAFIWKTDNHGLFMDRVYPSDMNSPQYVAIKEICERRGIKFRTATHYPNAGDCPAKTDGMTVSGLKIEEDLRSQRLPYLDTFHRVRRGGKADTVDLSSNAENDKGHFNYNALCENGYHGLYESYEEVYDEEY